MKYDVLRAIQRKLQAISPVRDVHDDSSEDNPTSGFSSEPEYPPTCAPDTAVEEQNTRQGTRQDHAALPEIAIAREGSGDQFIRGDFVHAGDSLNYRLYIPPTSTRNGSLLVMLHGCTQEATDFSIGTGMNTLARDTGYTVLYPSQNTSANPNRCWNWFEPAHQRRNAGEPALLSALTLSICAQQDLDPARVFVAGLSAGGAMALILAEEFPDVFAAVGVHSGLATGMASSTPQALRAMTGEGSPSPLDPATVHRPTLVIHGDQDSTVHPDNADIIVERCLGHYRQQHSAKKLIYRCYDEAVSGHAAKRHEYLGHDGVVVCRHWQLESIGHTWSGGDSRGSHTVADGISASESLLNFFDQCLGLRDCAAAEVRHHEFESA